MPTLTSEPINFGFQYSTEFIFIPLVTFDKLSMVALYGAEEINESLNMDENLKNNARIESLKRMLSELKKPIRSSEFKIKKDDKNDFNKLKESLDNVNKVINGISRTTTNQIQHTVSITINERHFTNCYKELERIRGAIIPMIHRAGFIFKINEDLSVDAVKKRFIEQG